MSPLPISEKRTAGAIGERVASLEARVNGVEHEAERSRSELSQEVVGLSGSISSLAGRVAALELSRKYFLGWVGGAAAVGGVAMYVFNTLFNMWKSATGQ